jgi:hypothetical protein
VPLIPRNQSEVEQSACGNVDTPERCQLCFQAEQKTNPDLPPISTVGSTAMSTHPTCELVRRCSRTYLSIEFSYPPNLDSLSREAVQVELHHMAISLFRTELDLRNFPNSSERSQQVLIADLTRRSNTRKVRKLIVGISSPHYRLRGCLAHRQRRSDILYRCDGQYQLQARVWCSQCCSPAKGIAC